jgi:hypothetical protein
MKQAWILILAVIWISSSAYALDNRPQNSIPAILDDPNKLVKVHHEPNIEFTVTNFGLIGSHGREYIDPETNLPAPGFALPAGSNFDYLFEGCLWIGAVIDTTDNLGNPIFDTLVSVGNDGWWGDIYELMPPPLGYQSLWEDYALSDEDINAVYCDTVTDSLFVAPDPNDGRPHIPLGLKITQQSLCWSSPGYDEIFAINFYIQNIGQRHLHDAWISIYYDGDVYDLSENPYGEEQGAQDDLCGFIEHGDNGIAWITDNDGQPYNGAFDYRSPRGVTGIVLLRSSQPSLATNFNWWISNINASLDWGPQLVNNYNRWGTFPGNGKGTPGGDKAKYQVMSNGEHDYDQAYCALYRADWIDPPPNSENIANGFDTRYLISFGPMQIFPGEVETVTVALVGGNLLHNNPENYQQNLRYHTQD